MLPNQVLNAIPRQKVKNNDGRIMSVLSYSISENFVYGIVEGDERKDDINGWELKDCEPVPEEPRGFRVEDFIHKSMMEVREWNRKSAYIFAKEVAAFSARRAREKAIEECLAEVSEQKDNGDDEFATGYYRAFNDIHAYIARLKTK